MFFYRVAHYPTTDDLMQTDDFIYEPIWLVLSEHYYPIWYEVLVEGLTYAEAVTWINNKIGEN